MSTESPPAPEARGPRPATARNIVIAAALILLTAAVFAPVARHAFVNFDDDRHVTANAHVRAGLTWASLRWAATATPTGNWHPLTWLSHLLDVELYGLNPAGHHLTSLALHAANTALLFLLLAAMTGAPGRSAFVAALFGVHPLHVESVAWVAERKDVLSALFWLLATGAYLRFARGRARGWYIASLLAFAGALMAKPMAVTLPFALLLLDFWPLGRFAPGGAADPGRASPSRSRSSALLLEKLPLFALSAGAAVAAYLAQVEAGTLNAVVAPRHWLRLANALTSWLAYVGKLFVPAGLAVFYPFPEQPPPWWQPAAAAAILAAVSMLALRHARRRGYLATGWFWYLGTLVPVIGLVQVGGQSMADRYTYLPLVGLFVAIAWGGWDLAGARPARRALAGVAAVVAVAALAVAARIQVGFWRDGSTLFARALAVTSGNWLMHVNLGGELLERGRPVEAARQFLEAARIAPENPAYRYKLGYALAAAGRLTEAALSYREALRLKPDYLEARNNLGSVLFEMGREDEALAQFEQALRTDPRSELAHYNIAEIRRRQGRHALAIEHYQAALRIDPRLAAAQTGLGIATRELARAKAE